jgi:hypothetical protein
VVPGRPSKKTRFIASDGFLTSHTGMPVVVSASELQVVERVGSTVCEWNPMVNLQPVGAAADDAGSVAAVDLFA